MGRQNADFNQRRRLRLKMWFNQLGCCFWCHRDLHFQKMSKSDRGYATIDHLKTKNQGREDYFQGGHVLAYRACNVERNRQELLEIGKPTKKKPIQIMVDSIWQSATIGQ